MAKLTSKRRNSLPKSDFAEPGKRKYPIPDKCISGDTLIPLLNGHIEKISALIGKEVWIYAYDVNKRCIVPAIAKNIRKTRKNTLLYEIMLDNGHSVICTENHPFLLRNGEYRICEEIKIGDAIMPFYKKIGKTGISEGREYIFQPWFGHWELTHHMVYREANNVPIRILPVKSKLKPDNIIHHIDGDKNNNVPSNLKIMSRAAHARLHAELDYSPNRYKNLIAATRKRWSKPGAKEKQREIMVAENKRRIECGEMEDISYKIAQSKLYNFDKSLIRDIHLKYISGESLKNCAKSINISIPTLKKYFSKFQLPTKKELSLVEDGGIYKNHKVINVSIYGTGDAYDMEVPKYHNFAIGSGVFVHNSHARNALSRVAQHGTPAEKSKVRSAVHRKYPSIGKKKK